MELGLLLDFLGIFPCEVKDIIRGENVHVR